MHRVPDTIAHCRNGYRFAKRQGKSNSTNALKSASNKHCCGFLATCAGNAFTFDSSRYLNRPSNLAPHDRACKPANGERTIGETFDDLALE
jgi:hypothetical protein